VRGESIRLPAPRLAGSVTVEEALSCRRSTRTFHPTPLRLEQVGQLLWAGQGISSTGRRTAPSAGATYPAYLYLVTGPRCVEGVEAGVYRYDPFDHVLIGVLAGDVRGSLARAALDQHFIEEAPVSIAIVVDYSRTTRHYGERGIRYVDMEAGHIAENLHLQAEALKIGTVVVGAFVDSQVSKVLLLPRGITPLVIMPFGFPRNAGLT